MVRSGGLRVVLQAPMQDGLSFDPFSFQQDGRTTPEVDVGGRESVHALVIALAVVGLHEGADWGLQVSRQVVGLEQDAVLEPLVPALDLVLGLRVVGSTPDRLPLLPPEPACELA